MSAYTIGWLVWIAAFVVLESTALKRKAAGDTLSEYVWKWFSVTERRPAWQLRRFILLAGLAWLALHFLTGGQF